MCIIWKLQIDVVEKRKKICVIVLTIAVTMSVAACGKEDSNNVEMPISVDIEETVNSSLETKEKTEETQAVTEQEQTVDISSIGKVRTVLSDSGVEVNPDAMFSDIPDGVAPELTYFTYDDVEGMVKAQQYLEEIGVSEENKTIVVCQKQEFAGDALRIFVISFEDDGTYRQEFYFESGSGSYELMLDEMITNSEYCDSDARYIRTEKMEDPTVDSYEAEIQYYESFEELFTVVK